MKNKITLLTESKYLKLFIFFIGFISSVGYAPFNFFPITIFSFFIIIYLLTLNKNKKHNFFLYGFLYSLGNHLGLLYWIAISFETADAGGYILGAAAILILCSFLAVFMGLAFYFLFKFFKNYKSIHFGIFFIFIFSLFDWLKGNIFWGFPWTPISTIWSFSSMTMYPFSILGVWGYSLLTYSLIISFYYLLFNLRKAILFSFPFILSVLFLPKILNTEEILIDTILLRVVQPNIKQEHKWNKNKLKENYEKLTSLTTQNNYKKFDLIILPETAINFDIVELKKITHKKKFGLDNIDNLILGAVRAEKKNHDLKIYNTMYLIKKNFKNITYHDKLKLVPFGEFIPFRGLINVDKLTSGNLDFSVGNKANFLKLSEKINILPLICYEVIFPKLSKSIKGDYNLIINITNDAWYRDSSGPYQHFSLAKIRAVMEGLTLIRAANTGISGIIAPSGKVISKLSVDKKGVIDYKLNLKSVKTMYSIYGETLFYLIMLTLFFLTCIAFFYGKNKKSSL